MPQAGVGRSVGTGSQTLQSRNSWKRKRIWFRLALRQTDRFSFSVPLSLCCVYTCMYIRMYSIHM